MFVMVMHNALYMSFRELNILIIEDNASMTKIYKNILNSFGVKKITSAISISEAKIFLKRNQPDLIICDYMLNGNNYKDNGLAFLKWLRRVELAPLCFTPVLMATGHASRLTVIELNKHAASAVLVKPLSPAILKLRIDKILRDSRHYLVEAGRVFIEGAEAFTQPKTKDNLVYDPNFLSRLVRNKDIDVAKKPKVEVEFLDDDSFDDDDFFELDFRTHILGD